MFMKVGKNILFGRNCRFPCRTGLIWVASLGSKKCPLPFLIKKVFSVGVRILHLIQLKFFLSQSKMAALCASHTTCYATDETDAALPSIIIVSRENDRLPIVGSYMKHEIVNGGILYVSKDTNDQTIYVA